MTMYDLIEKKKRGMELSKEEIEYIVYGYTDGSIPDYQMSSFLMAVWFNGMNKEETYYLTMSMMNSGEILDLSQINGVKVDKHSTGGVGDKTTLIVAPIVASLGLKTAKMSGRGLGHTGGTIDKLESIPGFKTALSPEDFIRNVKEHDICVVGQTGDLAPADKMIYALRDSTATVGSMPLIASSIMSKKLAAGASCIVLDVKTGSGAFMKTPEEAEELSRKMVDIGKSAGRRVAAVISDMDTPLGRNIGNSLEVIEAVEVLKGKGSDDLKEVCLVLSGNIIALAENISYEEGYEKAKHQLENGAAYEKFREFISAQGGSLKEIDNPELFPEAEFKHDVLCKKDGYITKMNAEIIGSSSVILGAGRVRKDDAIDHSAGIYLLKKTGDWVNQGDAIAIFYTNKRESVQEAETLLIKATEWGDTPPLMTPLVLKQIL